MREAGRVPGFTGFDRLHAYVYGRWTYLYIAIGVGEHPIARLLGPVLRWLQPRPRPGSPPRPTSADGYHGKVIPVDTARRLVRVMEPVTVADLERVIPYPVARSLILRQPDHLVALECPCRAARPDACQPLDVCLIVGEPFASFVVEQHPQRSRWITPAEAEAVLEAEHRRGHVQHAFFKDAMLGRFYAICNCCPCCCGAMQAQRSGTPMLASSGFRAVLEAGECAGCGSCADACPFGAIEMCDGLPRLAGQACMGCGVCVTRCPHGALRLVPAPERGVPLDLDAILGGSARAEGVGSAAR
jgi:ferredoxin